jgi:hypothetical protein
MAPTYCKPSEAGLASEGNAVARRLGRLLSALGNEINNFVVSGDIEREVWEFKCQLIDKLKADGWRVEAKETDGYKVRLPKNYLR